MEYSWWLGIGAGVGIMGVHAAVRLWAHALARRAADVRTFLVWELGGLGVRMMLVLVGSGGILLTAPVHPVVFVGTVVTLLVLSMILEVRRLLYRMDSGSSAP